MNQNPLKRELFLRNCDTDFYGDEILNEWQKFDEPYFNSVRDGGYTAIWIRGQLRDLATFEDAPHWDRDNAQRIEALNRIIEQGKKSDVGIYLYVNEPMGFFEGDPIFEKYPDLKGPYNTFSENPMVSSFEPNYAFCTQCSFTETYLTGGFAQLFAKCPDLAGVVMITTSEIQSHCFSRVDEVKTQSEEMQQYGVKCPRCKQNSNGIKTISDIITKIRNGIRQSSATAKIVAWNWSWGMHEEPPQPQLIGSLPQDVIIQCDMQRGGHKVVDGVEMFVDEYSFSYLGPSPLFIDTAKLTCETGHELWAKIMVNVTHEFLVVPYLPLFARLAKKMIAVRDYNARGLMGCWNYGGDATTPMARLGSKVFQDDNFTVDDIEAEVRSIARRIYGVEKADFAYRAWQQFDESFEYFPFEMMLIYYGPHMHGTGLEWIFELEETPMQWYWVPNAGRATNNLSEWCPYFTPEQVIYFLGKVTDQWKTGVEILAQAFGVEDAFDEISNFDDLAGTPGFEDFCIARTVYLHFMSSIAFVKFRLASIAYFNGEQPQAQREIILGLLEAEKPRIRAMRQIIQVYPKIPAAEEAQRILYTVEDLDQKVKNIAAFSFESGQRI